MFSLTIRRPLSAVILGLCALGTGLGSGLSAAEAEPAPAFAELLTRSQTTAPRLAEARAGVARAEGLALQAAAIPNPTLGLDVENVSGSGPYKGGGLRETTATLGQTLELGGKRAARISTGQADANAARARARQIEAEFAFDLVNAYAAAEASDRRLRLAEEALVLAGEDARIAGALVDAGREAELRRLQAQAAVQAARASVDEARVAQAAAFGALTVLSGSSVPLTVIPFSLLDQRAPPTRGGDPSAAIAVAVAAAEAEHEAALRRVLLERRRGIPDVTVSIGVRRFEEDDATALMAGISAPLPLFDRNRGNVAAARAEASAADARLAAARLDAEASVRTSAARIDAAEGRLAATREAERTAQEAYRLARVGYEAGKLGLIELLAARRAWAEARNQTIAAAVERVGAYAAQARLTGAAAFGDPQ